MLGSAQYVAGASSWWAARSPAFSFVKWTFNASRVACFISPIQCSTVSKYLLWQTLKAIDYIYICIMKEIVRIAAKFRVPNFFLKVFVVPTNQPTNGLTWAGVRDSIVNYLSLWSDPHPSTWPKWIIFLKQSWTPDSPPSRAKNMFVKQI